MSMLDIIKYTNKKRLIFTMLSFALSGSIVIMSIFLMASVTNLVDEKINIRENEYYTFVDENRYSEVAKNYYHLLEESFETVIPFVHSRAVNFEIDIIGTDTEKHKVLINDLVYDYRIINSHTIQNELPNIYVTQSFYEANENQDIINLNGVDFYISDIIEINEIDNIDIVIMSLEDYRTHINNSIYINTNGINKYVIDFYYIYSQYDEATTRLLIERVYSDVTDQFVISYEYELNQGLNEFSLLVNLPIAFFAIISIFSFLNMYITIQLVIKERRKLIRILYIVGMKKKQLWRILLLENSIISFVTAVISLLLGIFISAISISLIDGLQLSMPKLLYLILVVIILIIVPILQTMLSLMLMRKKSMRKLIN